MVAPKARPPCLHEPPCNLSGNIIVTSSKWFGVLLFRVKWLKYYVPFTAKECFEAPRFRHERTDCCTRAAIHLKSIFLSPIINQVDKISRWNAQAGFFRRFFTWFTKLISIVPSLLLKNECTFFRLYFILPVFDTLSEISFRTNCTDIQSQHKNNVNSNLHAIKYLCTRGFQITRANWSNRLSG